MGATKRNHETAEGWAYHNATKHSFRSIRDNAHFLDWQNKPLTFKIYKTLDPIELPREFPPLEMPALEAISKQADESQAEAIPNLSDLAQILYYSAGVTRIRNYPGAEILFRAAACTGALYEIDLYLVCGDLPAGNATEAELEAGVYHFSPRDFSLRRLRRGDYRGLLTHATAGDSTVRSAPVTIICAGTYWRNSWKYQARTYRHFGWDNGTILANLLATATALNLPAGIVMGFVDAEVNHLLGLDIDREVAFSMVSLGKSSSPAPETTHDIERILLETEPLSTSEVDYPAIREMHAVSSLLDEDEVRRWRGHLPQKEIPLSQGNFIPLAPFGDDEISREGIGSVILKRGSTRRFDSSASIGFEHFSTLLYRSMQAIPADFLDPAAPHINRLYLIVHDVVGLRPGPMSSILSVGGLSS